MPESTFRHLDLPLVVENGRPSSFKSLLRTLRAPLRNDSETSNQDSCCLNASLEGTPALSWRLEQDQNRSEAHFLPPPDASVHEERTSHRCLAEKGNRGSTDCPAQTRGHISPLATHGLQSHSHGISLPKSFFSPCFKMDTVPSPSSRERGLILGQPVATKLQERMV